MENKDQPAFPASASWRDEQPEIINVAQEGLTKREYFAGLAMQGLLAACNGTVGDKGGQEHIALLAIHQADELLKQLPI